MFCSEQQVKCEWVPGAGQGLCTCVVFSTAERGVFVCRGRGKGWVPVLCSTQRVGGVDVCRGQGKGWMRVLCSEHKVRGVDVFRGQGKGWVCSVGVRRVPLRFVLRLSQSCVQLLGPSQQVLGGKM